MRSEAGFSLGWVLAGVAAAAVGLGTAWMLAQAPRGLSQYDRLAGEIGCTCGTCPLRPIATCGCSFADGMLDELGGLIAEGHADHEIMDAFAANYTEAIRIAPSTSGLDLLAWAAPMLLLTVGGVVVANVLKRWAAASAPAEPAIGAAVAADGDALRAQLDRELGELDD